LEEIVPEILLVGFLYTGGEVGRFEFQNSLGFRGDLRDGRDVDVVAEVELRAHGMASGAKGVIFSVALAPATKNSRDSLADRGTRV
jgi:hypothetical protein